MRRVDRGSVQHGQRVLVVDDEPRLREAIALSLTIEGFTVSEASTGRETVSKVAEESPDLVTLDVTMPEMDGFEVLRRIREISSVPVILVTVMGEETDKLQAFKLGADDYVTKPFRTDELVSRILLALRSAQPNDSPAESIWVNAGLSIDFAARRLTVRGRDLLLRPGECRLLHCLVANAGRALTCDQLACHIWGDDSLIQEHLLPLHIASLRSKIEEDPDQPVYLTGPGTDGYEFKAFQQTIPIAQPPCARDFPSCGE